MVKQYRRELGMRAVRKVYQAKAYYHIYNRGCLQQRVFRSHQDYQRFVRSLRYIVKEMRPRIVCLAYALLPNHFHLVVWQKNDRDICLFMRKLSVCYAKYHCRKYAHVGHIFESRYKGRLLKSVQDCQQSIMYVLSNPQAHHLIRWPWVGRLNNYQLATNRTSELENNNRVMENSNDGTASQADTMMSMENEPEFIETIAADPNDSDRADRVGVR